MLVELQDSQDVCCCPLLTLAQEAAELRVSKSGFLKEDFSELGCEMSLWQIDEQVDRVCTLMSALKPLPRPSANAKPFHAGGRAASIMETFCIVRNRLLHFLQFIRGALCLLLPPSLN